jgi:hypothetical protein
MQRFLLIFAQHSELDQNNYSIIYSRLQSTKLPTEDSQRFTVIYMLSLHPLGNSTELAKQIIS